MEDIKNDQDVIIEQSIKMIDVFFTFYSCTVVLKESSIKEEIISFNID